MITELPLLTGASFKRGSSKQDYRTPDDFRNAVIMRFGVPSVDLAADANNKFGNSFIDKERDSFTVAWHRLNGLLWLNPPFNDIAPWARKCSEESALGAKTLFLTPASVGSNWFADYVHGHARVLFLNGRLCFIPNWRTTIDPASVKRGTPHFYKTEPIYPKDCILSCFNVDDMIGYLHDTIGYLPGYKVWRWKL
jgi:hypothetical protein